MEAADYKKIITHLKNQLEDTQKENNELKARLSKLNDSVVSSTSQLSPPDKLREAVTVVYNPDKRVYEKLVIEYDLNSGFSKVKTEKLSKQMHVASFEGVQLLEKQLMERE